MKKREYLKSKSAYIICHIVVLTVTILMLVALNPAGGKEFSVMLGIIYVTGAYIPLAMEYRRKRTFYNSLVRAFEKLDRKNLLAEMLTEPDFYEGALLYNVLKDSNRACLEEINKFKNMQTEYREYIELWVHEIKTPISSSKLIAQNNRSAAADSIADELDIIENFVEQALFYARSSAVENDYMIKEFSLERVVFSALKRDSKQLIGAGISVSAHDLEATVFTDMKWLEFILHQLISNAVKYARDTEPALEIAAKQMDNCCALSVLDNGIGIAVNELPRIFEKGFTGMNGRLRGKSTGMGLYICRQLCEKLGLSISAESAEGEGTKISIVFPKSSMTDIV